MTTTREREVRLTAEKCADYGIAAYGRRADQPTAAYNPLGGTDTQACANCLFFMSPNACTVVEDWPVPISPTGLSKFWTAIPAAEDYPPMRVVIVEEDKAATESTSTSPDAGLFGRIMSAVKAVFGAEPGGGGVYNPLPFSQQPAGDKGLRFYKDAAGNLRWFAWVSNKYRDRDTPPEIITDAAHREYVAYVDRTKEYPELQTWHTPGTRYGVADWLDYADGFLLASGPVDTTPEARAAAARLQGKDLGVSHGFLSAYADKEQGLIGWYRTFEISSLPPAAAANVWTQIGLLRKEATMGFRADKRAHLVEVWGEERVTALEKDTAARAAALTAAGIEFKDVWEGATDGPAPAGLSVKDVTDAVTTAITPLTTTVQQLAGTVAAVKATADQIPAVLTRLAALEKSDDEKIAAAFTAKAAGAGVGYRASQDDGTALGERPQDVALKEAAPVVDPGFAKSLR